MSRDLGSRLPASRGHKKSASTSCLSVMAGPSPSRPPDMGDFAFRDLTNTRPEDRDRSGRSRMTTAPASTRKDMSAGMSHLPGLMSPHKDQRQPESIHQISSPLMSSPSSSRLSRSSQSRKSRLSSFTTSSTSETLHESTEEENPPFLRPYTPHQHLTPADIPIPPSPAVRRSGTSSALDSDYLADETPRSKHRSQRSPRRYSAAPAEGLRRSESALVATDTTASEMDTPKRSSRTKRQEGAGETGTPGHRSSRRKSRKSKVLTVPLALDTLLSLRAGHSSRLACLTFLERTLAGVCPTKLTTGREPDMHTPLLALFGRHLSLMEQGTELTAEQYLMEIEVALNVLQGLCMLELGEKPHERPCAEAMSCSWVLEALVDLLLLLRKAPYRIELSLQVQLHCISTSFILLLHSERNMSLFDEAGGVRALALVAKDADDVDRNVETSKQRKEIALKCMEICWFMSLDSTAGRSSQSRGGSPTIIARAPSPAKQGTTQQLHIQADRSNGIQRLGGDPHIDGLPRSHSALGFRRPSPDALASSSISREVERSVFLVPSSAITDSNRSSSNSSSSTIYTSTTTESTILRTPHESYIRNDTFTHTSSRGYESERSEHSSDKAYLAPFAPSTPKRSARSGMPKSSSSQGLGYWTPQVKSRVRHDAVNLRDDQGLGQNGQVIGLPPRRPSSSMGPAMTLNQVTEEQGSSTSLFGRDLGGMMYSTTRSEARGDAKKFGFGGDLSAEESSLERSLEKAKERQERQGIARHAAKKPLPVPEGLPPRLPGSKSYIGLGMPGQARSTRPTEMMAESEGTAMPRGGSAMLHRMKKSSTATGLSGLAL